MKMKKSLLAVLLSTLFMFSSFVPSISCYAVSVSDINTYFDVQGKFYQILKRVTDISTTQEHQTSILNKMYDILENGGYSGSRSGQGLEQNGDITINTNGDVLLSVDLQNAIRQASQYEIDNNMGFIYVYSYNASSYLSQFNDQDQYHAFLTFLDSNSDKLKAFYDGRFFVKEGDFDLVKFSYDTSSSTYMIRPYESWNQSNGADIYTYDSVSHSYVKTGSNLDAYTCYAKSFPEQISVGHLLYANLIDLNTTQYLCYQTYDEMRLGSEGLQSYYVGNDFSTSNVSSVQTLSDSMLNSSISYNDVSNYVNSYYVTNQSYPTTENVYNYINNYNGSGGGSGGDNGNGSDDDDNNNIWDFLDGIGDFIGNLIRSLGNVLSGILSLLTDVIDMFIGENGLPNIVGQLIQYFLPFLPTEIVQLIEFSLLLAIILGVIRLIRGH